MADSTAAGVITAIATAITAIGGLMLALGVMIPNLRETRKIHVMVNQQRTDMIRYQAALVAALQKAGIEVPADQSLPPADGE